MPSGYNIDWSKYDGLIRQHVPNMTISVFTNRYVPHISAKAVGARCRRLGIKPSKHILTKLQRRALANGATKVAVTTPELLATFREMRDGFSLQQIAEHLRTTPATLSRIARIHNIPLSVAGKKRARDAVAAAARLRSPWNKGKKLPPEMLEKMAIGRQRQSGRLSQIQAAFYRTLDELNVNYLPEEDDKCRFGPWTFDCRIVHAGYDFLVEVQGGYIHSLPKNIGKDKAKATYMARYFPEIEIKYIWEHEFGAASRVKQSVLKWLGLSEVEQVVFSFDEVAVRPIDIKEANQFLSAFHYLGESAGTCYGAFVGDKLVAASVWGCPTRVETAQRLGVTHLKCYELKRFAIHDAYHQKNFASWLLSRYEKLIPQHIEVLVSFADPGVDHSGTIYKAANWKEDGQTESSYFYIDVDGYVMLKKTPYNQAHKIHMTEADFAETYGYTKVKSPVKFRFTHWRK